MDFLMMRCEVDVVKKILRVFVAGDEIDRRFIPCDLPFDPEDLLSSKDLEDLVSKLSPRPYHSILRSSLKSTGFGTASLENTLDLWYFTELMRVLRRAGAKGAVEFLKKQADVANLMWIYRARILFGLESERVVGYLLPIGRLSRETLREMASVKDEEEYLKKLADLGYEVKLEGRVPSEFLLERVMVRYLVREAKKLLRNKLNGFDMLVGYLHLLEYELRNITTVIETVRYRLEPEVAKAYLIRG